MGRQIPGVVTPWAMISMFCNLPAAQRVWSLSMRSGRPELALSDLEPFLEPVESRREELIRPSVRPSRRVLSRNDIAHYRYKSTTTEAVSPQ
jgi:hypothetical protein